MNAIISYVISKFLFRYILDQVAQDILQSVSG